MYKILAIEDNHQILDNTAEILSLAGYAVNRADNGKTGVEMAMREKPDLIICDIMMPGLDGYGVLHLVRKNTTLKNTPFIFLTAKSDCADMRKGMALGADDYITKPFEETDLLAAIECRLNKAEAIKEQFASSPADTGNFIHSSDEREMLESFVRYRDINKYKKKQVIYSEGNRPQRLYIVQKGKVKTYKINEDGKEMVTGLYNEGDFLGYVALLEGISYKETAEAMEDAELAIIPKDEFTELLNTNREANKKMIALLSQNIMERDQQLLGLAYNSLRKKVAEALLALNKKFHANIHLSRENLAHIAGTATESLTRTLSDFKEEKLIDIQSGEIVILNERKLANLVN